MAGSTTAGLLLGGVVILYLLTAGFSISLLLLGGDPQTLRARFVFWYGVVQIVTVTLAALVILGAVLVQLLGG